MKGHGGFVLEVFVAFLPRDVGGPQAPRYLRAVGSSKRPIGMFVISMKPEWLTNIYNINPFISL